MQARCTPLNRPIVQARYAERAAIAHALGDHLVGVRQIVAVLPDDPEHVAKMLRLRLPDDEEGMADSASPSNLFSKFYAT